MKRFLIMAAFAMASSYSLADCKSIYADVEENLKDIAAFKNTAYSYRKSGFIAKSDSFDQKISNSQTQINILLNQAKDLKCKPYKESLNPEKYNKSAENCGSNPATVDFDCNRANWKPNL